MKPGTSSPHRDALVDPLLRRNPVVVSILGICPALAVSTRVSTALVMGLALTFTLCGSAVAISLLRRHLPRSVRLIVMITVVATLVIVVDQVLAAYAFAMSKQLSVFVGLIVTNCIVLGRAEAFSSRNPPWPSFLDAVGNGAGFLLVLVVVGAVREVLGAGTLLGVTVLRTVADGGGFVPLALMARPVSAFFLLALVAWGVRALVRQPGEDASS